jgi:hypothetical protein
MEKIIAWTLALTFPVAMIIFVVFINISTAMEWNTSQQLRKSGVTAQATVVDRDKSLGLKAPNTYYLIYRYEATERDGKVTTYTTKKQVDENLYKRLNPDSIVTIWYLDSNPAVSDIQENQVLGRSMIVCVSIDVAFVIFIVSILKFKS